MITKLTPEQEAERRWSIHYDGRPWGANARAHHMERAARVKEWRTAFRYLALEAKVPALDRARVVAVPFYHSGPAPDIGAAWEAIKAAIDGVVDAGVLANDSPAHLVAIELRPPTRHITAGLTLIVEEVA